MNPANLRDQLVLELNDIASKRLGDNLWFNFSEGDHLVLSPRPESFLAAIWEALVRLFTSKLAHLENKFVWITERVEEYLARENDQGRLGEFLNTHTDALNEIFRCAMRMQQADRISEAALQTMQQKPMLRDYVLMSQDEQGYEHLARLQVTNRMDAQVLINFPENYTQQGVQNIEIRTGEENVQDIPALGENLEMNALVTQLHTLARFDSGIYEVSLLPGGKFAHVKKGESEGIQISFSNQTPQEMNANAIIHAEDGRETLAGGRGLGVSLQPQTKSENYKVQRDVQFITGYKPTVRPLRLGCKSAKYSLTINENGVFVPRIIPQRIVRTAPPQQYDLRQNASVSLPNPTENGIWMVIKSPEIGYALRCFVPPNGEKTIQYEELRNLLSPENFGRAIPLTVTYSELAN